jgi:hypothetical protein
MIWKVKEFVKDLQVLNDTERFQTTFNLSGFKVQTNSLNILLEWETKMQLSKRKSQAMWSQHCCALPETISEHCHFRFWSGLWDWNLWQWAPLDYGEPITLSSTKSFQIISYTLSAYAGSTQLYQRESKPSVQTFEREGVLMGDGLK